MIYMRVRYHKPQFSLQIPECTDPDPGQGGGQWELHYPGGEWKPEPQPQLHPAGQRYVLGVEQSLHYRAFICCLFSRPPTPLSPS